MCYGKPWKWLNFEKNEDDKKSVFQLASVNAANDVEGTSGLSTDISIGSIYSSYNRFYL